MGRSFVLKICPFCGGNAELVVRNPELYGAVGVYVRCISCEARTKYFGISKTILSPNSVSTPITEETVMEGEKKALMAWNRRSKL